MSETKGIFVVFMRRRLREKGADAEQRVLARMSPENRYLYESCTAGAWLPTQSLAEMSVAAAEELYRDADEPMAARPADAPLVRLGREQAKDDLTGVYSFPVRVATVPFLIKQTARLWSTHHKRGKASTEMLPDTADGRHRARMVVREFPDFPPRYPNIAAG